jgi:hypothetical protein
VYSKIHFQYQFLFHIGDELKQTVSIVVDLASVFDPDGVDIYFLNREPMFHVRNAEQLVPVFAVPPAGLFIKMVKYFYLLSFV